MTPKNKAEELVDKYYLELRQHSFNYDLETAKQCALIAVDEILNFDINAKNESQFVIENHIEEYWQQVKQEIQAL